MIDLITLLNRGLDRLLGIKADEVLNPQKPLAPASPPAPWIKRAADRIAAEAITPDGRVDYSRLAQSAPYAELQTAVRSLPLCKLDQLGERAERMAFWINLYNALVIHGVVHYGVRQWLLRYLDDPAARQALARGQPRWRYMPYDWSLNAAPSG